MTAQSSAFVYACGQCEIDLGRRELRTGGAAVPLGGRAFDVLEVLVRSAGKLVTKDDFMAGVWPGAVVGENTLQVYISAIRKALGPDRGLLKTASGRGYQLLGTWAAQWDTKPAKVDDREAPPRAWLMPTNLPLAPADLIGREAALQHLRTLNSVHRLVTLTGPGGIGKTKLVLQAARDLLSGFDGAGWLIDLATISNPNLVPSAVAAVLGLTFGDQAVSATGVARAIGRRRLLLILDNCEHVIESAAGLAAAIIGICPHVSLLATSTELLNIPGEHVFRVVPLDVPDPDLRTPDELLQHSAVRLFISRMQTSDSEFVPGAKDLAVAASICRHLDGIPLAIEFAAARAATLGLEVVLSRLNERFKLLTIGRRTAQQRHQTLRATLDWSYQLLPVPEQFLLRSLGVFPAGFTLEAAAAVVSGATDILAGIEHLAAKSLVVMDAAGGRWRLLETTRAYALEKLTGLGESAHAARLHAVFFHGLLTRLGAAAEPQSATERMAPYVREMDNVRAALDWAFSEAGDPALGSAIAAAFVPAWLHLSLLVECRERVTQALNHLQMQAALNPRLEMRLHIALGLSLINTTGLVTRAEEVLAKGLILAESLDDRANQLVALWALWFYHMASGELRAAEPLAGRFLVVARRTSDPGDILLSDHIIGNTMHFKGNQPDAYRYFKRILASPDPRSDGRHSTWVLSDVRMPARAMLARVLLLQGLVDQASQEARSSFESERVSGRPLSVCPVLRYAVFSVAVVTDDLRTAAWSVAMLNDLAERHGSAFWSRIGHCMEGALLIKRGDLAAGTTTLSNALRTVKNRPPDMLAILAEGFMRRGQFNEAVATIDERLERSEKTAEQWYDPELLRLKGETVLRQETKHTTATAETCFQRAIELARRQGALLWELRAALSVGRLRIRQGRHDDARHAVASVYRKFTEGFETQDLGSAKAMLDEITAAGPVRAARRLPDRIPFHERH